MNKIKIPNYSLKEELINSISHGVGAILSLFGLILMIVRSISKNNNLYLIVSLIYGISSLLLYLASCLYHAFSPKSNVKKIFRVIDHCNVFLLEAGTFTPVCLILIGGVSGIIYFSIIWIITIIGIILNCLNVDKYQMFSLFLHLAIGWSLIFVLNKLISNLCFNGLLCLLIGGIFYSIGSFLYKIGSTKKYMHSVFHFFCLGGSIFHFFMIFLFII